jgi:hypothetical protein
MISFSMIIPSLWKKLHHKTISNLFSRVDDIGGHKDNKCAPKKTPNKIWCKVSREYIKFPRFTKYQKTQKESSWDSNECSKQKKNRIYQEKQNQLGEFFGPPLIMLGIFADFIAYRGWEVATS